MATVPGRSPRAARPGETKSPAQILQELWALVRAYARQETLDPLRNLGRFLGWGVAGSILVTFGLFMVGLALLRFLQRFEWLQEHSWASYAIELVFLVAIIGLLGQRLNAALTKLRGPEKAPADPAVATSSSVATSPAVEPVEDAS